MALRHFRSASSLSTSLDVSRRCTRTPRWGHSSRPHFAAQTQGGLSRPGRVWLFKKPKLLQLSVRDQNCVVSQNSKNFKEFVLSILCPFPIR